MAGGLPIRRAGQCCSSTRGRVTARPRAPGLPSGRGKRGSRLSSSPRARTWTRWPSSLRGLWMQRPRGSAGLVSRRRAFVTLHRRRPGKRAGGVPRHAGRQELRQASLPGEL